MQLKRDERKTFRARAHGCREPRSTRMLLPTRCHGSASDPRQGPTGLARRRGLARTRRSEDVEPVVFGVPSFHGTHFWTNPRSCWRRVNILAQGLKYASSLSSQPPQKLPQSRKGNQIGGGSDRSKGGEERNAPGPGKRRPGDRWGVWRVLAQWGPHEDSAAPAHTSLGSGSGVDHRRAVRPLAGPGGPGTWRRRDRSCSGSAGCAWTRRALE